MEGRGGEGRGGGVLLLTSKESNVQRLYGGNSRLNHHFKVWVNIVFSLISTATAELQVHTKLLQVNHGGGASKASVLSLGLHYPPHLDSYHMGHVVLQSKSYFKLTMVVGLVRLQSYHLDSIVGPHL